MVSGRMTSEQAALRERWELAQQGLGLCISLMDAQTILRVKQALRRDPGLEDLLGPAVGQLLYIHDHVSAAQSLLDDVWHEQNEQRWPLADADV